MTFYKSYVDEVFARSDKPLVGKEYGAFRDTVQNLEPKEQKVRKAPIEHLEKM